jgi:hypothetical protein
MALIITSTPNKQIHVQGTDIELASVYIRLEFGCRPNGIVMEIAFYTYADRNAYLAKTSVLTDIPTSTIVQSIDPATQTQGLQSAHDLAKTWYEDQGYDVTIDLN